MSLSVIAMVWNFGFNLLFDKWMLATIGTTTKSKTHRIYNAIFFELGLLGLSLPVIAYALNISLIEALILDLGFAVFALFYSYSFNYLYDKCFPLNVQSAAQPQNA
ncbi:hypothetical protein JCM19240_2338 [Vibrio maritimus]|uniref:Chlorhexidine efflux transporter domain-containing protein n=1 Tax=Vibrio maritimus TaxID=990268 RepID=A0A090TRA4_9VIBR|nr:hypothetical protein JCM19240_2338 [Vibrio maritimus]